MKSRDGAGARARFDWPISDEQTAEKYELLQGCLSAL